MLRLLLGLLPERYRLLIEMGRRVLGNVDSREEQRAVLGFLDEITRDGRISPPEWSQLGSRLHIYDG